MRLEFQKAIAGSQFTLPVVAAVSVIVWLLFRWENVEWTSLLVGLGMSAFAVYMLAELNNRNVLLRISSRLISSLFAMLLAVVIQLHHFQTGHIILLLSLASYFPFFQMYQSANPLLTFLAYLPLAFLSFIFPQILFLVPAYWLCQIYMRGMSWKCWFSSILALLLPYWVMFGIKFYVGDFDAWLPVQVQWHSLSQQPSLLSSMMPYHVENPLPSLFLGYKSLTVVQYVQFVYILSLLSVGIVDMYLYSYLDKTRTRIIYRVILIHALSVLLFLLFQIQYFYLLLPLLIADTAIIGGHFIALTYNKYSHIFCLFLLIASIAVCLISYLE